MMGGLLAPAAVTPPWSLKLIIEYVFKTFCYSSQCRVPRLARLPDRRWWLLRWRDPVTSTMQQRPMRIHNFHQLSEFSSGATT